ncbi:hypothetical protein [Cytobacillus massiliigabonensis]|uniref:hypothetical protein n=1 Tax=Cytobacillus massiliigabonensis TaxID=1871011 RepID=UPI001F23D471|nr:hypothetical protein [Cytobacillus massiliigabonensis]
MKKEINFNHLLIEYRTLWNNRLLSADEEAEQILKTAIERELKDENAHPRVRKSIHEKFYFAVKRVMDSHLAESDKQLLILVHLEMMEKIK